MTEAEIRNWLRKDQRKRVVLVELDYMYQSGFGDDAVPTLGTIYWSNFEYVDNDASTPTRYQAALMQAPEYERSLDRSKLRGQYNVNVGDLVINNADGEFDYLIDLAMDGSEVRVYIGDETWARSDFVHLYTALALKVDIPAKKTIRIDLRDPGLLLNKSIGGTVTVGGTGPNANQYRPLIFGFIHQLEPILVDAGTSTYAFADTGTNTECVAVRNDGVPVTFTDNGDGTFTLAVPPSGNEKITCDAVSYADASDDTSYRVSDAFDTLLGTRAGMTALGRYNGNGQMFEFHGFNDYRIGKAIAEKQNCVEIANDLADTANGFWAFTRLGSFFYDWLRPEALTHYVANVGVSIAAEVTKDDVRGDKFALSHNLPTYVGYQAYGNVNQVRQETFASSLTEDERAMYTREGYLTEAFIGEEAGTSTYVGSVVTWRGGAPELYHLSLSDSQVVKTLISGPSDTDETTTGVPSPDSDLRSWASVRRSQNLPWVEFVDVTVGLDFYTVELGDIVNVVFPRFDFDGGRLAQVVSIRMRPSDGVIELGLVHRRFSDVSGIPVVYNFLAMETDELVLKEDGGKIIVSTSGGGDVYLVDEDGETLTTDDDEPIMMD